jgi:hypothetical protein
MVLSILPAVLRIAAKATDLRVGLLITSSKHTTSFARLASLNALALHLPM